MKVVTQIEFDRSDLNSISDTVFNALDKENLTDKEIMEYWDMLPDDIKYDAMKWGVDDSPTRDNMYVWFKDNCK